MKALLRVGTALAAITAIVCAVAWFVERKLALADIQGPTPMEIEEPIVFAQMLPARETQILLQTRIVEIHHEKLRELGLELSTYFPSAVNANPGGASDTLVQMTSLDKLSANIFIDSLRANGVANILAEPSIVAVDGRPASFHNGGEIPILVPQSDGNVAVEFRKFGTSVDFTAKKQSNGKLRLELHVVQSEIDASRTVTINGTEIPGLKSRSFDTALDAQPGRTVMLCGEQGDSLLVMVTPEVVEPTSGAPPRHAVQPGTILNQQQAPSRDATPTKSLDVVEFEAANFQSAADAFAVAKAETEDKLRSFANHFGPQHPAVVEQRSKLEGLANREANVTAERRERDEAQAARAMDEFEQVTHELFPDVQVELRRLGDGIILSGTIDNPDHARVLTAIAENLFPKVINNLASNAHSMNEELQLLREDITILRYEVGRLIKLLEHRQAESPEEAKPTTEKQSATDSHRLDPVAGWPTDPTRSDKARTVWRLSLQDALQIALGNVSGLVQFEEDPNVFARSSDGDRSTSDVVVAARDVAFNVEEAYWQLWVAQRKLDANKRNRDTARDLWNRVRNDNEHGQELGQSEAQTRAQYFHFCEQLSQSLVDVDRCETALRRIVGLVPQDGRLIRPSDAPETERITFDGTKSLDAVDGSPELEQQRLAVQQAELMLGNVRNNLVPKLDVSSAYRSLQLHGKVDGFEFTLPVGHRRELAAIRNAELNLAREQARKEELKSELSDSLTDAFRELESAFDTLNTYAKRRAAAQQELDVCDRWNANGDVSLDIVLDAQRRFAGREAEYHAAAVRYANAIKKVRFRRGTLLSDRGFKILDPETPTC